MGPYFRVSPKPSTSSQIAWIKIDKRIVEIHKEQEGAVKTGR